MTSRGSATIEVSAGLAEVLACQWVVGHATEVDPGEGPSWQLCGEDTVESFLLTCGDKGYDSGVIGLDGVNWYDDAAMLAAAPRASWQAFLAPDTEQPGLWLAYTPATGLVEGSHVDHDVMIPVGWADPATRTGAEDRQLARITAVRAALPGMPPGRWQGGVPAAGTGGGEQEPRRAPDRLTVRVTQPALPGTPAVPMRPPTPGRSLR